jgi:hypothetical protein
MLVELERALRPSRKRMAIALAAAAAVACAAIVVAVVVARRSPSEPPADSRRVVVAALLAVAREARKHDDAVTEADAYVAAYDRTNDPAHLLSATRALGRAKKCRPALATATTYEVAAKARGALSNDVALELDQLRRTCAPAEDPRELERKSNDAFRRNDFEAAVEYLVKLRQVTGDPAQRAIYIKRIGDYAIAFDRCQLAQQAFKAYLDEEPRARKDWTASLERAVKQCEERARGK